MNSNLGLVSLLLTSLLYRPLTLSTHTPPKIVLITLDGVRYQDMFEGTDPNLSSTSSITSRDLLPNLYHDFVDQGIAIGQKSEIQVSGPNFISLPGYLEILRGHPTNDCFTNNCRPHSEPSVIDAYHSLYPTAEVSIFASWDVLGSVSKTSSAYIINAGKVQQNWTYPTVPYSYAWEDEQEDVFTGAAVNNYLEHSHHPDFMWIAMGDSDEYAHKGSYTDYVKSLQNYDRFIGHLVRDLPESTTFIITTDHGRGVNWKHHGSSEPTSKRTWLMMRGPKVPHKGMVDLGQTITASWITPTIEELMDGEKRDHSIFKLIKNNE